MDVVLCSAPGAVERLPALGLLSFPMFALPPGKVECLKQIA